MVSREGAPGGTYTSAPSSQSALSTRSVAPSGQSGAVFAQFPWFDDNVAGVLVPFAQRLQRLRYDTWAEFQWDVAMEKAAVNRWGMIAES